MTVPDDPRPIESALRDRIAIVEQREVELQAKVARLVDLLRQRGDELNRERRVRAQAECDRDAARDALLLSLAAG